MAQASQELHAQVNRTYTNPILPGWNSDPSCTHVPEWNNTFFCTTSSFLAFPGVPVYASKDLTNWKHISNALTRPEQLPELSINGGQMEGIWASTIRYRNGTFYLITSYVQFHVWKPVILLFQTTDPYDDAAWSQPVRIENPANDIDPDLFWDHDDKLYMSVAAGIWVSEINIETGSATQPFKIWNGTGDRNPEGPHIYWKDDYYYLLIGEGGTESNHSATIARSRNLTGPYEGYEHNPLMTAKNTPNYFQTIGHADLFQDGAGNWWAIALATRSGPAWEVYPMGRETILSPMKWEKGQWPVVDPVRGKESGPLPPINKNIKGSGHWLTDPDVVNFAPGSSLPKHFMFWRPPKTSLFEISPKGHENTFRISPSRVNLTADDAFDPAKDGLGFIARRQAATVFNYSVDISFEPTGVNEEAGATIFLTQYQHIDLSIINLPKGTNHTGGLSLRFRAEASGRPDLTPPATKIVPIPASWQHNQIRLSIAANDTGYAFSAASVLMPFNPTYMGSGSTAIVSAGTGPFTGKRCSSFPGGAVYHDRSLIRSIGTIMGAFNTNNGGNGTTPAYFSRWRYTPISQKIEENVYVPA